MAENAAEVEEVVMDEELLFDEVRREPPVRRDELVREGEVLAGKYRVERIPGRNGLGVLVQVRHMELGQEVTLKFLVPDACMYPEFVQRFIREARAAVKVQGEHVARVTDVGRLASGAPYMVREFLRGPDLSEVLKVRGPLPIAEACDYIIQAAEAVAEAHVLGIAHRNLRPTTLVVTRRSDGAPLVKVFDFAAAEALHVEPFAKQSVSLVGSSALLSSLPYLSPEQVRDPQGVDFRADVYGLGAILYELLAGIAPFEAESAPALLAMVAADLPVRLRTLRFGLPMPLEEAVMRALEKSRELRFSTVAEFALALKPYASADSSSSIERIVRLSRRGTRPPPVGEARVSSPAIPIASSLGFDDQPTVVSPMPFNERPTRDTLPLASDGRAAPAANDRRATPPVYVPPAYAPPAYVPPPRSAAAPVERAAASVPPPMPTAPPMPSAEVAAPTAAEDQPPPPRLSAFARAQAAYSAAPGARRSAKPRARSVSPAIAQTASVVVEPEPNLAESDPPDEVASPEPPKVHSAVKTTMMPPARARSSISWGSGNSWAPEPEAAAYPLKKLATVGAVTGAAAFILVLVLRSGVGSGYAAASAPPPAVAVQIAPTTVPAPVAPAAVASATAPATATAAATQAAAPSVAAPITPAVTAPVKAPVAAAPVPAPPPPRAAVPPAVYSPPRVAKPVQPAAEEVSRSSTKVAAATPAKGKDLFSDPD